MSEELINARYGDAARYCENDEFVTKDLLRKLSKFKEEKEMNLIITLIGSIKNSGEAMMEIYNKLTLRGDLVMLPYMGVVPEDSEDTIAMLHYIHQEKMRKSDFVVVVDQNGYIGKDTQAEIKWCEKNAKRVIYASDFAMLDTSQPAKSKK